MGSGNLRSLRDLEKIGEKMWWKKSCSCEIQVPTFKVQVAIFCCRRSTRWLKMVQFRWCRYIQLERYTTWHEIEIRFEATPHPAFDRLSIIPVPRMASTKQCVFQGTTVRYSRMYIWRWTWYTSSDIYKDYVIYTHINGKYIKNALSISRKLVHK